MRPRTNDMPGPVTDGAVVRCNALTYDALAGSWRNLSPSSAGDIDCSTLVAWPDFPGSVLEYGTAISNAELAALTEVSIEGWIQVDAGGFQGIVTKWKQYDLVANGFKVGFLDHGAGSAFRLGATILPAGTWAHVVVALSSAGGFGSIYLNGALDGAGAYSQSVPTTWPIYLGQEPGFWVFDGKLQEARIYNRVLSPGEVLRNYNASRGRYL